MSKSLDVVRHYAHISAIGIAAAINRPLARHMLTVAEHVNLGLALGLTETQAREVIDWWIDWDRKHLSSMPWDLVRESLTRRAIDRAGKWHP